MNENEYKNYRRGLLSTCLCYVIWGLLPLYWHLLTHVNANEILAHRIAWSFVLMSAILIFSNQKHLRDDCRRLWAEKKKLFFLIAAALLITANWLTYIWAVTHNHVLDTSIGYYLNPLMSVFLGITCFSEKLNTPKKASLILAATGIILMTWQYSRFPWISVFLASSFAVYGAVKKSLHLHPVSGITLETLILLAPAVIYIYNLGQGTGGHFSTADVPTALLLIGCGAVTAVPLLLFAYGANNLPLNVLGFIQYISPTISFLLSVFFFKEELGFGKLIALSFIWVSLIIFTISSLQVKIDYVKNPQTKSHYNLFRR